MKRIVITGGAGFIGSVIVDFLQRKGHEVFVIDNLSFGVRSNIKIIDDAHFFDIDILNQDLLNKIVVRIQPQWVIHLAAVHFIPYCNQYPFASANINIQGTINLLESLKKIGSVEKVFFASTAAVYPIMDIPLTEEIEPQASDIYGLSKVAGEKILMEFQLSTSIPTIICRFFNAFGPNETNPHLIPTIHEQIMAGGRKLKLGNLEPKRDYIHTHDMALAINGLLNKIEEGCEIFNLGSGIEYSVLEIVRAFEMALGESLSIEVDETRVRKSDRMHLLADIDKLASLISWQPVIGLEAGIRLLIGKEHLVK